MKVNSVPFPAYSVAIKSETGKVLRDPLLPAGVDKPQLWLSSAAMSYIKGVSCFASGQGAINVEKKGSALVAQAKRALPAGRSRYNCTAPTGSGRFYWFSQTFFKKHANGEWYKEY